LAAARAVIFAQLVNDPGYQQGGGFKYGKNKKEAAIERKRLFKIIEDLVLWESTTNEEVLERARAEIRRSWREVCDLNKDHPQAAELFNSENMPGFHDPFAGGGAIPLEAQRLGLEAYASDLNPVAVLINKAMIEIPPKFAGRPPVHPSDKTQLSSLSSQRSWPSATGLAEDVRYYGAWMRAEAQKRIGHLYPEVEITVPMAKERPDLKPLIGQKLTVIAWLWARTVKSPNPAFSHVDVPLSSTFTLSQKPGNEAFAEPIISGDQYHFSVKLGATPENLSSGTSAGKRQAFRCLVSDVPIAYPYIRKEGMAGRLGQKLVAVVAEGVRGRIFLSPTREIEDIALAAKPEWKPQGEMPKKHRNFQPPAYGMETLGDIFTNRQLTALTTFCGLVSGARDQVYQDAIASGMAVNGSLVKGDNSAMAYAEALSVFLGLAIGKSADYWSSICFWHNGAAHLKIVNTFGRQAIPMTWDFAEANPFSSSSGNFERFTKLISEVADLSLSASIPGKVEQADAQTQQLSESKIISTDPPYYDNIAYADLSDFFYVWLRGALRTVYPELLSTITVPKAEELTASASRHGGKDEAEKFFVSGMTQAIRQLATLSHPQGPITIYYAFKQSDTDLDDGTSSTGWETFLQSVHEAGLQLTGTWPMRTEYVGNLKKTMNALASSIVLVCRKRPANAPTISRREFIRELNGVLPDALDEMTRGSGDDRSPVAPVDLSQAIIGPGMAVFSKYAAVLEADGSPMSLRTALQLINRFLAEDDFDHDTQFCLHWFEQHGWNEAAFGEADTLARAKGTSVDGVRDAGVIKSGSGKVSLLKWSEYPTDWDPRTDKRLPVWEALHHLIRALHQGGDSASGALLAGLGGKAEAVRQLAYRLYTLCERLGQAEDARAYNELITSWTGIESAAATAPPTQKQGEMF
jgi:putative DNA methylase